LNLALAILDCDPSHSGAERYCRDLAAALARRGHQVTVLCRMAAAEIRGAVTVGFGTFAGSHRGRLTPFIEALGQHLRASRYDLIHAMTPVPSCDIYHLHAGAGAETSGEEAPAAPPDARVPGSARAGAARRSFRDVHRELLLRRGAPLLLCPSARVAEQVRRTFALPPDRLEVLHNGTDLETFDPARDPGAGAEIRRRFGIGPHACVGLLIGQDFERKGLREAIDAIAAVQDAPLVLLVVGREDPAPYAAQAVAAGAGERIVFAGATADPGAFYQAADFFVLPTRDDPCSLVVLEALAMGLPVVSTAENGACELMADGTHGFVLPHPGDVSALAAAMRAMLDPDRRRAMAEACLALRPRLSFARHLDRLLEIYARVRPPDPARESS
jgi:UDP-glucose:(heptosyl)LPS alpha-1,3-glucosyltransferase